MSDATMSLIFHDKSLTIKDLVLLKEISDLIFPSKKIQDYCFTRLDYGISRLESSNPVIKKEIITHFFAYFIKNTP